MVKPCVTDKRRFMRTPDSFRLKVMELAKSLNMDATRMMENCSITYDGVGRREE